MGDERARWFPSSSRVGALRCDCKGSSRAHSYLGVRCRRAVGSPTCVTTLHIADHRTQQSSGISTARLCSGRHRTGLTEQQSLTYLTVVWIARGMLCFFVCECLWNQQPTNDITSYGHAAVTVTVTLTVHTREHRDIFCCRLPERSGVLRSPKFVSEVSVWFRPRSCPGLVQGGFPRDARRDPRPFTKTRGLCGCAGSL